MATSEKSSGHASSLLADKQGGKNPFINVYWTSFLYTCWLKDHGRHGHGLWAPEKLGNRFLHAWSTVVSWLSPGS